MWQVFLFRAVVEDPKDVIHHFRFVYGREAAHRADRAIDRESVRTADVHP